MPFPIMTRLPGMIIATLALLVVGGNPSLAMPSLAVLSSSSGENATVAAGLAGNGQFSSIAEIANTSTLTAADLAPFDVVFTFSDFPYANPTGVGDALRSYVDGGGSVVATTYALSDPWSLEGGITQPGYLPFQIGTPGYSPTLPIVATLPGDPIFNGIDLNTISVFINSNYINPVLDPGAILLATDQFGAPIIARNAAGTVYAINAWPGIGGSGDFFPLLANVSVSAADIMPSSVSEPAGLLLVSLGLAGLGLT